MEDIHVANGIVIPDSAIQFKYSRSSGKGGQNVNKVATKVELVLDIKKIQASDELRHRIETFFSSRLSAEGTVRIVSQESRSQWQNKQITIEKMIGLVERAAAKAKKRVPTKKTKHSQEKRLTAKKILGKNKKNRRMKIDISE